MNDIKIFYIWKTINGLVPNFGLKWDQNENRGTMVNIPILKSEVPKGIVTLRDQSLSVHGGKLYNSLPQGIRDFRGSKETFKLKLDTFLSDIPDNPVLPGMYPDPICRNSCKNSNTIPDWIRHLKMTHRRKILPNDIGLN